MSGGSFVGIARTMAKRIKPESFSNVPTGPPTLAQLREDLRRADDLLTSPIRKARNARKKARQGR